MIERSESISLARGNGLVFQQYMGRADIFFRCG
jgi:hypothetical protein